MKKKIDQLTKEDFIKTVDLLYTAASSVKGRGAVKNFLRDLLSKSERVMLGRRIWIARMILAGDSRRAIQKRLRVGPVTIAKVSRWLEDALPGYEMALKGAGVEFDKRAVNRETSTEPFSYAALKRRYPLHFLLFPAPKPKQKYRD